MIRLERVQSSGRREFPLARSGTPLYALKEHLAPEHLKAHAARLSLAAQIRHNGEVVTK